MTITDETELMLFEITGDIGFVMFVLKYFTETELKALYLSTETNDQYLKCLMVEAKLRHAEAKQKY